MEFHYFEVKIHTKKHTHKQKKVYDTVFSRIFMILIKNLAVNNIL